MKRTLTSILCAAVVLVASLGLDARQAFAVAPFAFPTYTVTDLGTFGGSASTAVELNNVGEVVGTAYTVANIPHPFLYSNGTMTDLGTLGGCCGFAGGINDAGQIVGQTDNAQGFRRGFLYSNGLMTEIPTLGGSESRATDINASGQIVGRARLPGNNEHAFLYENGQMLDLGTLGGSTSWANSINASGQIVGGSHLLDGRWRAYRYSNGVMVGLPTLGAEETSWSVSFDANDTGQIVGWSELTDQGNCPAPDLAAFHVSHGFIYNNGQMTDIGTLGGSCSIAASINNLGHVVGWADTAESRQHAFYYSGGRMQDLNHLIPADSGWELTYAVAINDAGQIAGYGQIGGQTRAFLLTPRAPSQLIDDLIRLVKSFNLPQGIENSLIVKLQNVQNALAADNTTSACNAFTAFIHQVNAQAGKALTVEQADQLLAGADQIKTILGCP